MSDDSRPGWDGHDPGVLDSLAIERNGLAWQRTALSWVAAGAAVARYFASDGLLQPRTSIGMLMVAIGALIWFDGNRSYHARAQRIRSNQPTHVPARTLRTVAVATSAVIAAIVAIEVAAL